MRMKYDNQQCTPFFIKCLP